MTVGCSDSSPGSLRAPELENYYHGYITRTEAEKRLKLFGIAGSYLLRASPLPTGDGKWHSIYVLSFLSSNSVCQHFKLIPRLHCFQLGGRLFDCLRCCLSRYYVRDIMPGERLKLPIPPTCPPVELYSQQVRAIENYEPESANDRLSCSIGDRFLLVSEDPDSHWVFVICLRTRHSGYLPKCCVQKEYPEMIELLDFFHPDLSTQPLELLRKAGPYSYLLRPSHSCPGWYTLLLYDGSRIRKFRLELVSQCEEISPSNPTPTSESVRRNSEPAKPFMQDLPRSRRFSGDLVGTPGEANLLPRPPLPCSRTVTRVYYNQIPYPNVESVVADIENFLGMTAPTDEECKDASDGGINGDTKLTNGIPHIFKPVERERKPNSPPPSSSIYMALRFRRQPSPYLAVPEIHGELSLLTSQRKKWKPYYAQLDRKQGILSLREGDKRKVERFDLSKCDYFPVHHLMHDRPFCFGLVLFGASSGDRDELVFAIDPPTNYGTSSSSSPNHSSNNSLDPLTYAGRPEESSGVCHCTSGDGPPDASPCPHNATPCLKTVFSRWVRCVRMHCRNTRFDAVNEEDLTRRQTCLRCYRTIQLKINGAKFGPLGTGKLRRDEPTYALTVDGIEIARAFPGSSSISILLEDFPCGFRKLELRVKEDKKKRHVAMEVDISSDSSPSEAPYDSRCQKYRSAICDLREGSCSLGSITYKELHVLPFTAYSDFREAIRHRLDTDLVQLCVNTWKNLANDVSTKPNFVCSLLLACTEMRCHLQLIASLLRLDMPPDNPNDPFRGTTLGTQILEQYCNLVCTEWRNKCFQRVRAEVLNGPGSPRPTRLPDRQASSRSSVPNTRFTLGPTGRPYSLSAGPGSLQVPVEPGSSMSSHASVSSTNPVNSNAETEWHLHLLTILIDDLINYLPQFPLQLRWIYSQLQALQSDPHSNSVVRNLVILRGICPCLVAPIVTRGSVSGGLTESASTSSFTGSPTSGSQSNMAAGLASDRALVYVSKTLVALAGANLASKANSDPILSPEQFMAFHERLTKFFRIPITTPLSPTEIAQLDKLCEQEAVQANCRSLSREWAQLASFFLEGLGSPDGLSTLIAEATLTGTKSHSVLQSLIDLEDRTRRELVHAPTALPYTQQGS